MTEADLVQPKAWIGIDQSYSGFGLVLLTEAGYYPELWKFPKKSSQPDGERLGTIYVRLSTFLLNIREQYDVAEVVMEGYAYGMKLNREKLGELGGIVKFAVNTVFAKDPVIVPPRSLKLFVTGKGTASKEEMVAAVQEKWAPDIKDDNVADAMGLAMMAKETPDQI